jgi:5-formyltetrahydrofolate cyclo-ligase
MILVALCLTQQLLDSDIPMTERDWRMDGIFYADGLVTKNIQ